MKSEIEKMRSEELYDVDDPEVEVDPPQPDPDVVELVWAHPEPPALTRGLFPSARSAHSNGLLLFWPAPTFLHASALFVLSAVRQPLEGEAAVPAPQPGAPVPEAGCQVR